MFLNSSHVKTRRYPLGVQRLVSTHQPSAESSMGVPILGGGGGGIRVKLRTKVPKSSMRSSNSGHRHNPDCDTCFTR